MGTKIAKAFSSYKSHPKLFLNFLLKVRHKNTFEIFEILKIEMLTFLFYFIYNIGPNGSENFQTLLLQIAFQQFSNLS